jgi:hypothetical protein
MYDFYTTGIIYFWSFLIRIRITAKEAKTFKDRLQSVFRIQIIDSGYGYIILG